MLRQLGLHRPLNQSFGQLLQEPAFPDQIFRFLVVFYQLVEQFFVHFHHLLLFYQEKQRLHNLFYTLEAGSRVN